MFLFGDVTVPVLKAAIAIDEAEEEEDDIPLCCRQCNNCCQHNHSYIAISLLVIMVLLGFSDCATNMWEYTMFNRKMAYDPNKTMLAGELPGLGQNDTRTMIEFMTNIWQYCLIFVAITAILKACLTIYTICSFRKIHTRGSQEGSDFQKIIIAWSLFNNFWRFLFDTLGVSTIKVILVFASPTALDYLMTQPSKISGTITLIVMVIEYFLQTKKTYSASCVIDSSSCNRAIAMFINTITLLFLAVGLGASLFSVSMTFGLMLLMNFASNLLVLAVLPIICFVFAYFFIGLYYCLVRCENL